MKLLTIKELNKIYPNGVHALKDIDLEVEQGEFLVIIGLSGSGKSTLLRCINRLHDITSGKIFFRDKDISRLSSRKLRDLRSKIGMIFQHFNLIDRQNVLMNVLIGKLGKTGILKGILGKFSKEEIAIAKDNIATVGLHDKTNQRADYLSGGQKQRVAIARALMQEPSILLADEPVASLDPATSHSVMKYLEKINRELNVTIICNLHFLSLVRQYATRVIALKDGKIVFEGSPENINEEWFTTIYGEDAKEVTIN